MQSTKTKQKATAKPKEVPYVIKDRYLQVTIDGKPFSLDNTHPTFAKMKKALREKRWAAVPKLVTLAQSMFSAGQGNVIVKNGVVYYKGKAVDSSLTQRIVEMIKGNHDIKHMLLFMDKLYSNPNPIAIREFFDWLRTNDLPITDDGCFLAYKSVNRDYTDKHTGKIDNSPGAVIKGNRKWFDTDYRSQCSSGYHVCSKQYGLYGSKVMAVKINPKDVLSAVQGKMRVVNYEVLRELGTINGDLFKAEGFSELEKQLVVEVRAERKELLRMLLANKAVKRLIRNGKMNKASLQKANYARMKTLAQRFGVVEVVPEEKETKLARKK